jgi:hypothetical protein
MKEGFKLEELECRIKRLAVALTDRPFPLPLKFVMIHL